MTKRCVFKSLFFLIIILQSTNVLLGAPLEGVQATTRRELKEAYEFVCRNPSDINEHLPVLYALSKECQSAVEIGVRDIVSTWAILQGLAENRDSHPSYIGIDLRYPPMHGLYHAQRLATANGVKFDFWPVNDMTIEIEPTDLLFIDSLHTYCHLTYELEKFSPMVKKYIAMHDTSFPWGERDDSTYTGDYSEYPAHYDRTKRGSWLAVEDFLNTHPEWELHERRFNNHGFTILKRKEITHENESFHWIKSFLSKDKK